MKSKFVVIGDYIVSTEDIVIINKSPNYNTVSITYRTAMSHCSYTFNMDRAYVDANEFTLRVYNEIQKQ